jgi:glycosyltransferase involved in cell wall biosynthesis
MKLVYVCNEYPPVPHGGIGIFVQTIARELTRAGHSVTVVGCGDHHSERADAGVRVVTLARGRVPRVSWLIDRIALHRWLKREVSAGRCELIEIPDYEGPLPFPFSACPVVVRLHLSETAIARETGRRPRLGVRLSERLTLRTHRRWIAVSEHSLALTIETFKLRPQDTATIYYPIEIAHPDGAAPPDLPELFVLFAGYVCARKGAYNLAEAARLFLPRFAGLHLVFLGGLPVEDGIPAEARIRTLVGADLASRVHCYGRVSHAALLQCMSRTCAFVFPSRLETFGIVVGEAMLSGVPVVTSICPPFPEYVTDGQTGLMVPPDDAAALSAAVCRILEEPAFALRLTTAARRLVTERFSLGACVRLSEQFYNRSRADHAGSAG